MRTALDSSVLLLVSRKQPGWRACRDRIDAAASVQADRLAALDRGYLRSYFPTLARLDEE